MPNKNVTLTKHVMLKDGKSVAFEVDGREKGAAYFVLGVRKCGSSIMNSMVADLARINSRHYVDVGGRFFAADVPEQEWRNAPGMLDILGPGNVYGGFRAMPHIYLKSDIYKRSRKILLVRDPRDALVSEYFSIAYSHSLPATEEPHEGGARDEFLRLRARALAAHIEQLVLQRAGAFNNTMMEYEAAAQDKNTQVFRYEDVILDKRPWLHAIADHFGWSPGPEGFIEGMMSWADVVPTSENNREFVRKVVPGDHKEKLTPEVIEQLNVKLAPAMQIFGYS